MGKWINVTGEPGRSWYVDGLVDLEDIENRLATNQVIVLPLRAGGTIVIRPDRIPFLAFGDDGG